MVKQIIEKNENVLPNSREMEVLKQNFPSCFNGDGSFDIERFKEFLKDKVNVTKEGYELKFLGKNYARLLASVDTTTVIVPDEENNNKPENKDSENIYITGDNLDALKHLLQSYSGKVKCIYIDPPYNTGSDGFVYNDRFNFTAEDLAVKLSIDEEQAERILDLTKRGSASHSAWLMFMYPRLLLARDLLSDDGVIFISIDDNEQSNLKLLCDDVFGEQNFVGQITVVSNPRGRDYGGIAQVHEYVLTYTKLNDTDLNLIADENAEFTKFDEKGGFELRELRNRNVKFNKENRPNLYYPFYIDPNTKDENDLFNISLERKDGWIELYPLPSQGVNVVWRWGKEKASQNLNTEIKAKEKRDGGYMIVEKYRESKMMARSLWNDNYVNTERGTLLVKELLEGKIFDYPKPVEMIMRACEMATDCEAEDIVLDFFSGSATTAHAVMQLNAEDGGKRKFVMVQLPEPVKPGSEAEKANYKTIDEIGRERIRRAAAKIKAEHPDTTADLGFKHYVLQEPQGETLDKLEKFVPEEENGAFLNNDIFGQFGLSTVLTTWLVRDGYGLNAKPQELDFAGYKGYYIGQHLYLIDEGLTDEAVTAIVTKFDEDSSFNPDKVVVFGYNFLWTKLQALKDNLARLKDTEKNIRIVFDVRY